MKNFLLLIAMWTSINMNSQELTKPLYKNNLTIKPFNLNSVGLGIGVIYERYLDNTNNFSMVMPVDISFLANIPNTTSSYYNSYGFNVNPGIRFYFVEPRKFNWYIGTSMMFGIGYLNDNSLSIRRTALGSLVNVGFKGTIKDRVTYELELGNGIKYVDKFNIDMYPYFNNERYMGSLHVGFGYKF